MRPIAIVTIAIVMTACSAFNLGDANRMRRGMSPAEVESIVSKGPRLTTDFTVPSLPGEKFSVMVFDLALGSTAAEYYAVFRNGKLYYWGHPYEFNRHPDAAMNAIGMAAVEAAE